MRTSNTNSWRPGRSLDVPARSMNLSACSSLTANLALVALPSAFHGEKQHDYQGPARVNTSP